MVTEHVLAASSQITGGGRVGIILIGVLFLAGGLYLAIKPERAAKPPKWRFKNGADVEPSAFTVGLARIGGIVWTIVAIAMIVVAAAA